MKDSDDPSRSGLTGLDPGDWAATKRPIDVTIVCWQNKRTWRWSNHFRIIHLKSLWYYLALPHGHRCGPNEMNHPNNIKTLSNNSFWLPGVIVQWLIHSGTGQQTLDNRFSLFPAKRKVPENNAGGLSSAIQVDTKARRYRSGNGYQKRGTWLKRACNCFGTSGFFSHQRSSSSLKFKVFCCIRLRINKIVQEVQERVITLNGYLIGVKLVTCLLENAFQCVR